MELERFCKRKIQPHAEELDRNRRAIKRGLRQLGRRKLLAVRAPNRLGGHDFSARDYFSFVEQLQSYSTALGFLQRQHQAAVRLMLGTPQESLISRFAKGKLLCGVSVSQLRQPNSPSLTAKRVERGFLLSGKAPWVSGYRIFDRLVVGFFLPQEDNEGLMLIPFKKSRTLTIQKPIETIALTSLQTVTLEFKEYLVEEKDLLKIQPIGTYAEATSRFAIHFVNLSGLALALKRLLEQEGDIPPLCHQYEDCREDFLSRSDDSELYILYARMNRIATELMHLVRFKKGASALICPNAVERLWRELMLFSVIALNDEVRAECLKQLFHC